MSKKSKLRQWCIEAYGEEFAIFYDQLASGGTVGGLVNTITVVQMIEDVKQEHSFSYKIKKLWRHN